MPSPRPASVTPVALGEVAGLAGAVPPDGARTVSVAGVSLDSRTVRPGDLYAALPGSHAHGAAFAGDALAAGAVAVLTDPTGSQLIGSADVPVLVVPDPRAVLGDVASLVYGHPARALTLVGVTGTNGKTTTAYLIEAGLRALHVCTGLIGTVETRVGDLRLPSVRTTPEATDLHALLAVMREAGAESVVMEVSSHALAQHRVDGAGYDVALFTNLSQDHLDFHGTMEEYFTAKAALFAAARSRRGVVCVDDPWGVRLAAESEVPVVTVGSHLGSEAEWVVRQRDWPFFTVTGAAGELHLQCRLPGTFNVVNTAMAAVTLLELGHPLDAVGEAMAHGPAVPGRMEVVTASHPDPERDPRCIVDYGHTPEAVAAALRALRPSTPGRLVVVLGAGGDRDKGKRAGMGAAARSWADRVIVTDDNPRSEDPAAIRAEVRAGAADGSAQVTDEGNRWKAINAAVTMARREGRPGDNTVVVLGKGHETGQEVAGVVHPFDDRQALRAALDGLVYRPEATA